MSVFRSVCGVSPCHGFGFQVFLEPGEEDFGHVDDLFSYVDAVVTVDLTYLVEGDDVRTVYPHELLWGQHLFHSLHGEMGDERFVLTLQVEHDVVLHAADVYNL